VNPLCRRLFRATALAFASTATLTGAELSGVVNDAASGRPLPARVYLVDASGRWHLVQSASPEASAIPNTIERPATGSVEIHTTLSTHPFRADVPPGRYTVRAERGLEYHAAEAVVDVPPEGARVTLGLTRWIDLAARGWFSSDVFLHRPRAECANLAQAEDINVLFPIDTEKPNWPWTVALVPTLQPQFFHLLNNHHWRTAFGSGSWKPIDAPDWMRCERDADGGLTEDGWTRFGLQLYYALLNCGFRLVPTAGSGSGVHPVPAGFSRTYVHQPNGFSYETWMTALEAGQCFVTNGPALLATFNHQPPGHQFRDFVEGVVRVHYEAAAAHGVHQIELIHNGEVVASIAGATDEQSGALQTTVTRSGWLALRAWELTPDHQLRLAHTAPVWIDVADFPAVPKAVETAWLLGQVESQRARHAGVLPAAALADYDAALETYRKIHARAR
jgi:hypothetical protein